MPSPRPHPRQCAIYALTTRGAALGAHLVRELGTNWSHETTARLFVPGRLASAAPGATVFDSLPQLVAETFHAHRAHLFITASGIAVRAIAPHLGSKDTDPAVLVLDQEGENVISMLSGHLGGANELAREVAALLGARAIITTATDTAGVPAADLMAMERGLAVGNLKALKRVNAALAEGVPPQVYDPADHLGARDSEHFHALDDPAQWNPYRPGIWVSQRTDAPGRDELRLYPQTLFVGLGCRRGVPGPEIEAHLRAVLAASSLAPQSVALVATIEDKRDEAGITETARALDADMIYYDKQQLDGVAGAAPSKLVREHMGVDSVCEAAAILASRNGKLIVPKTKSERVTCAVAVS